MNIQLLRSKIESDTLLSDPTYWSDTLKIALNICMSSGFPIAICWGDQFTFFYNDHYSAILGDKHPIAMGKPVREVYPEIWDSLEANFHLVVKESRTLKFSEVPFLLNRNGYSEECYFDYTLSPITSTIGEVAGIFNVVIETTSKVIGDRRNKILNQFILLQTHVQHFKSCLDECAKILNNAYQEIPFSILYVKGKDNIYKLAASCGLKEQADHVKWPVEDVINLGKSVHISSVSELLTQPITTFFPEPCCEAIIVPLKQNSSVYSGYLIAGISPRKKLDADYQIFLQHVGIQIGMCLNSAATFEEFLKLEHEKDHLLSIISHEMKTPITGIKAYSQLAVKHLEQQGHLSAAELIKKMNGQIAKLQSIVSDMVDGINFLDEKIIFYRQEFDFDDLIQDIVSDFKLHGSTQSIKLNLNVDRPFNGDKLRMEQVIFNLVSNAIKYSSADQQIEISSDCLNDQLTLSVRDYGIGISTDEQPRIFDRFYRSVSIEQYTSPGIGLGLFIVKKIVKHLGGKIWVKSVKGEGSTFYIALPFNNDDSRKLVEVSP